ncbi:MAG TPA: PQQ-binding-like beta-propeller repeat protein [Vicinamibacterales bacterium]
MSVTAIPTRRPLRLWPAIAIVALVWLTRVAAPIVGLSPWTEFMLRVLGGFAGAVAVLIWWLGFSRASWVERVGVVGVTAAVLAATLTLGDPSMLVWVLWYAAPVLSLAAVVGAVVGHTLSDRKRLLVMAVAIALPGAATLVLRIPGVAGRGVASFAWRWTETSEQRLLGRSDEPRDTALREPSAASAPTAAVTPAAKPVPPVDAASPTQPPAAPVEKPAPVIRWSGFRGTDRNGTIPGVRITTDWAASPPVMLWRRPVGPGWASFAVRGSVFYTQEQRGDEEIVSAYSLTTGEPVWRHRDRVRLNDPMGGPGPRATPTLTGDRVYTMGSTGILNALGAESGSVVWSRNLPMDLGTGIPTWGYSSSPLIVGDLVVVAVGGTLAAYDLADGHPRWVGPAGGDSYSSPQLATIDGVSQLLLASTTGTTSVAPATGEALWTQPWNTRLPMMPIVQPAVLDGSTVLVGDNSSGLHRLAVSRREAAWTVDERWVSNRLKPYFNDFVVHRGHAYGFDGAILAAVDLANGERKWKGGRYGQGQIVLLPDQDVLLVVCEDGDLALVKAVPDGLNEIARVHALSGKTWNHPVLVGDILLIRNGEEMAAFRLALVR